MAGLAAPGIRGSGDQGERIKSSMAGRDRWARRVNFGGPGGPTLPKAALRPILIFFVRSPWEINGVEFLAISIAEF